MAELLFGQETEYAIAGRNASGAMNRERILILLMESGRQQLVHLPDLKSHDGLFTQNSTRIYVDCGGHPEIATPECSNPHDLVRYTLAGHRILTALIASIAPQMPKAEIMCFRNNVDYSGSGTTWGCHESYAHRKSFLDLETDLIPHLVTRLIYTGAGGFNSFSRGLEFTLSPRVAHLRRVSSGDSTNDRGIWHTKTEPLGAGRRLHVLCGDSLCSHTAAFLKTSTTALAVALADAGLAPGRDVQLADPLDAIREVASDVTTRKPLHMANGGRRSPLDIQRHYLQMTEAHLGDGTLPAWAAEACQLWRAMLDRLEGAPSTVTSTLDWGIKLALYSHYAHRLGIHWENLPFWNEIVVQLCAALSAAGISVEDRCLERALGRQSPIPRDMAALEPLLRERGYGWDDLKTVLKVRRELLELDTRFGELGDKGLFQALDAAGVLDHRVSGVDDIEQAMVEAPAGGRARIRGEVIRRLAGTQNWQCDWEHIVNIHEGQILDLSDPFSREESWRPLQPSDWRTIQGTANPSPYEQNPYYQQARDRAHGARIRPPGFSAETTWAARLCCAGCCRKNSKSQVHAVISPGH